MMWENPKKEKSIACGWLKGNSDVCQIFKNQPDALDSASDLQAVCHARVLTNELFQNGLNHKVDESFAKGELNMSLTRTFQVV